MNKSDYTTNKKYFPILFSKAGNLSALKLLSSEVKVKISPIINVLGSDIINLESFLKSDWSFENNQVLLDLCLFKDFRPSILRIFFERLYTAGVNVIPVVQCNNPPHYIEFVKQMIIDLKCRVCLRTSNKSGGFIEYNKIINELLENLNISRYNTILVIDLGYAQEHNFHILDALTISLLEKIPYLTNWLDIVIACGSFPESLENLPSNSIYHYDRLERKMWLIYHDNKDFKNIKYGDYGIKNPESGEIDYPGNFSIKYSSKNEYVIYTGDSNYQSRNKNDQYITMAGKLISSVDYAGQDFSWGDEEIFRIAHESLESSKRKPGNAATWVQISQNHHMTMIMDLLG